MEKWFVRLENLTEEQEKVIVDKMKAITPLVNFRGDEDCLGLYPHSSEINLRHDLDYWHTKAYPEYAEEIDFHEAVRVLDKLIKLIKGE